MIGEEITRNLTDNTRSKICTPVYNILEKQFNNRSNINRVSTLDIVIDSIYMRGWISSGLITNQIRRYVKQSNHPII